LKLSPLRIQPAHPAKTTSSSEGSLLRPFFLLYQDGPNDSIKHFPPEMLAERRTQPAYRLCTARICEHILAE
jgi:hypothetical protein